MPVNNRDGASRRGILKSIGSVGIGASLLSTFGSSTAAAINTQDRFDLAIKDVMDHYDLRGLSVAIARDDRLFFAKGYGEAVEGGESVEPYHRFRIASISKPITAVAIMQLVERGSIELDEPVFGADGVLGTEFGVPSKDSSSSGDITVEHLLEHTSGFQFDEDPTYMESEKNRVELIEWVVDKYDVTEDPGSDYKYENFNYFLLGEIIGEVTGDWYDLYVKRNILSECGITRMDIGAETRSERTDHEVDYYDEDDGDEYDIDLTRRAPVGGWIATPIDLLQLTTGANGILNNDDIVTQDSRDEMFRQGYPYYGYGFGWAQYDNAIGHNGRSLGALSALRLRDDGWALALMTNTEIDESEFEEDELRSHILELLYDIIEEVKAEGVEPRDDEWPGYVGDSLLEPVEGSVPQDLNLDGKHRDINGDGAISNGDVTTFFDNQHAPDKLQSPEAYDFDGNGKVGQGDTIELYEIVNK